MYVDESGDIGLQNSPTTHFILTGLVIHETNWLPALNQLINFRRRMKASYGLLLKEEIHASAMINNPGDMRRIKRHERLSIIRHFADEVAQLPGVNIINIVIDKRNKSGNYDVFEKSWQALIQRLENTTLNGNFPHPQEDKSTRFPGEGALILPDNTDNAKLQRLLRKMRRHNYVPGMGGLPSRNILLRSVIEDPYFKDSAHSYFIQAADTAAFLLYQNINPNAYMRKKGGANYFSRLDPVLCTVASRNPGGIVRL